MVNPYGPAARKMTIARMLMANANQPIQNPFNAISNLANTYMGLTMAKRAEADRKADQLNKAEIIRSAIRARRGFINPDDTYTKLAGPLKYFPDDLTGIKSLRNKESADLYGVTLDEWNKMREDTAAERAYRGHRLGVSFDPLPERPSESELIPFDLQPGAKVMRSPKGPMVPGSRQAMADVLMGSGRPDLMTMGMKLDPAFRDPLKGRAGTAIQYNNELNRLIQTYGRDSDEVKRFMQVMKIGQPNFYNLPQGVVKVPTAGGGDPELVSRAELSPKDRPENIKAGERAKLQIQGIVKRTEGRLDEGRAAAEMLPVLRRSVALLEDIPTGGMDKFKMRVKTFFGVESADEGELAQNLGKAVLSQLRKTFGAAFTEREGERLNEIEANFGKSPESNLRQLRNLLAFNEEFYRQGVVAAGDLEDEGALESLRSLNKVRLGLDEGLPEVEQPPVQPQVSPSPDDDAARAWLQANPNHPKANDVRDRLGMPRVERQ